MLELVNMVFGSHLYGTHGETSDRDYKGVFIPCLEDVLCNHIPRSLATSTKRGSDTKNTAEDVDTEKYSLHYFLHLACEGETVALDMLHADVRFYVDGASHAIWRDLRAQRHRFYTKNLKAFVGYARHQAAKYGVKGSRLAEAKIARDFLASCTPTERLCDVWEQLPAGEHIHKSANENDQLWTVCGKAMTSRSLCHYYLDMLTIFINRYGARAIQAEQNQGIDWKAVSHAFRAGYQVLHILRDGGFEYPLAEAAHLKAVKSGSIPWATAGAMLDAILDDCESASHASTLPEQVDRQWVERWLLAALTEAYAL